MVKVLDLFSGIGGFSLGLERAGMETVAFCEFDKHAQKVLAKHWPDVPIYDDVRTLDGKQFRGSVDVVCGGFPCQDISVAGNQAGIKEGTRSGLWSECARLLGEIRPRYAIFENVTALLNGEGGDWFKRVLWDISSVGYDAEWHCIPASELGAHHHRDRIWIIAYPKKLQRDGINDNAGEFLGPGAVSESGGCCGQGNVSNTSSIAARGLPIGESEENAMPRERGKDVADSERQRQQGQGKYEQSIFAEAFKNRKTINAFSGGTPDIWKAEPDVGGAFDGFPEWLDGCIGKGMSYEESLREREILRSLWNPNAEKALQRATRGLGRMEKAEALFFVLREYEEGADEAWLLLEGEEVSENYLRSLWLHGKSTGPSYRPEHQAQYEREYSDIMQELSRFLAHGGKEGWEISCWEDALTRVENGVPDRSHRLKQLGNAVVPQIPEIIGRAIMKAGV
jgi:DNA-cytosine methyltransferase